MELKISIELRGKEFPVGSIVGSDANDAEFKYDKDYMALDESIPVSVSLPFREEAYSPRQTRVFFEGLLPEGFTRRTVAEWIHADEGDYLHLLSALGKECLGALKVSDTASDEVIPFAYEKLSLEQVRALAEEGATKSAELVTKAHLSLTGASGKVGLYYDADNNEWYLPIGSAPSTHIVKQSHVRLDSIVTNEQLSILTAKKLGIEVPETFIINTGNYADSDVLFATARYDRVYQEESFSIDGITAPLRLHQEDFGQALGVASSAKYEKESENHLRSMMEIIRQNSSDPIKDQMRLWDMLIFNFLIGNTDAHLKNFSLVHGINPRFIRLAPAYDIVSTTVYPQSTRNMAFRIAGKHSIDDIDRGTFKYAAAELGLGEKLALRHFDTMASGFSNALEDSADELSALGFDKAAALKKRILNTAGIKNL